MNIDFRIFKFSFQQSQICLLEVSACGCTLVMRFCICSPIVLDSYILVVICLEFGFVKEFEHLFSNSNDMQFWSNLLQGIVYEPLVIFLWLVCPFVLITLFISFFLQVFKYATLWEVALGQVWEPSSFQRSEKSILTEWCSLSRCSHLQRFLILWLSLTMLPSLFTSLLRMQTSVWFWTMKLSMIFASVPSSSLLPVVSLLLLSPFAISFFLSIIWSIFVILAYWSFGALFSRMHCLDEIQVKGLVNRKKKKNTRDVLLKSFIFQNVLFG